MAIPQKMVSGFDYVVAPQNDDFGPFTSGTLTDGLQEALVTAGAGGSVFVRAGDYTLRRNVFQAGDNQTLFCEPGVRFLAATDYDPLVYHGLLVLGHREEGGVRTDYDGFVFEGNGCLIDAGNLPPSQTPSKTGGILVSGRNRQVWNFALRNFRVANVGNYGVSVGLGNAQPNPDLVTRAGNVLVENFDVNNGGWVRVWQAEQVVVRNGRCRMIPRMFLNGLFVTSQKSVGTADHLSRFVRFENVDCDSTSPPGGATGDAIIEVQGSGTTGQGDKTFMVEFRHCRLRTNPGAPGIGGGGGIYLNDADLQTANTGLIESVYFRDCIFDGPLLGRRVLNSTPGYVVLDHCEFLNSAGFQTDTFVGGTSETRPYVIKRHYGTVTLPNQVVSRPYTGTPFVYQNDKRHTMLVVASDSTTNLTITQIDIRPRGHLNWINTRMNAGGAFVLAPGDALQVSYNLLNPPDTFKVAPFDE